MNRREGVECGAKDFQVVRFSCRYTAPMQHLEGEAVYVFGKIHQVSLDMVYPLEATPFEVFRSDYQVIPNFQTSAYWVD